MMGHSKHYRITHNTPEGEDPTAPYCHRKRNDDKISKVKINYKNSPSPISSCSLPTSSSSCFFCVMNEPEPSLRRAGLAKCFKEIPLSDDPENVLVLSFLWNAAMSHPDGQSRTLVLSGCFLVIELLFLNSLDRAL